jgi:hypothetical protein
MSAPTIAKPTPAAPTTGAAPGALPTDADALLAALASGGLSATVLADALRKYTLSEAEKSARRFAALEIDPLIARVRESFELEQWTKTGSDKVWGRGYKVKGDTIITTEDGGKQVVEVSMTLRLKDKVPAATPEQAPTED